MKMRAIVVVLFAVAVQLAAGQGMREKRGFNTSGYSNSGYGRSDERDASVSQEGQGCNDNASKGYGNSNSGSHEQSFRTGHDSGSTERVSGGRTYSRAAASASASAYSRNQKANLVEILKPSVGGGRRTY